VGLGSESGTQVMGRIYWRLALRVGGNSVDLVACDRAIYPGSVARQRYLDH